MNLQKFLEPIELAGTPLKNHQAYRMDGKSPQQPSMRNEVGLGDCNCGDYFTPYNANSVLVIEETQLVRQIKRLKKKYHYLQSSDQMDFVTKQILQENRLKAYGSMLVLCRLVAVCIDAKNMLKRKNYKFWIVVSGKYSTKDARIFRNLKSQLIGLLSHKSNRIVDDVEVLPSNKFVQKLSQNATTP
jgi:hypothetical protein